MQPASPLYLTNLTALRGIAALLVVVFHANEVVAPWISTDHTHFFDKLYLMVDLFFVLSGFVMCHVYQAGMAGGATRRQYRDFLVARFARVYPLHLASLAASVAILLSYFVMGKPEYRDGFTVYLNRFSDLPAQLLLLQSIGGVSLFSWNVPSWSISAEWWAYMLFPVLAFYIPRWPWATRLGLVLLILTGYAALMYVVAPWVRADNPGLEPKVTLDLTWNFGFARGLFGFTLGTVVYQAYRSGLLKRGLANGWAPVLLTLLWAAITHFPLSDVAAVALFPLLVLSVAYGSPALGRLFLNPVLQRLGDWSYSIYMWHWVLLNLAVTARNLSQPTPPPDGPPGGHFFGWTAHPRFGGCTCWLPCSSARCRTGTSKCPPAAGCVRLSPAAGRGRRGRSDAIRVLTDC